MSTSEYPAQRLGGPPLHGRAAVAARAVPVDVWIVAGLVVLAAAIRILVIDNQSYWMDEALTAYESQQPFGAMLHTVMTIETTPPLYFILAWAWAHVFGNGAIALRSISTIAGVALVPIAYLCGRELVSSRAGVLAAAFTTVNPFLIWYSQEARTYMLLAVLSGASFLWFIRARREPSRKNLVWWTVWSSLALTTHFFAGFLVAPEALWLLWTARTRIAAIAVGVVALVQAAMLPFAFTDTSHGVGWIASVPRVSRIGTAILEWGVSIMYRRATVTEGLEGGAILLVVVVALLVVGGDRPTREGAAVAGVIAGFVFLAPLALGLVGQDYFLSRNVIPAYVPLSIVVAAACVAPRTRLLGGALAVALLAMFSYAAINVQTHPYLQRPKWRNVARALGPATAVPRAILAADGTTANPLKIYLPGVSWVQSQTREVWIREIDVVGATKRLPLEDTRSAIARPGSKPARTAVGAPVPRRRAPRGAILVSRFRVNNWIVARFIFRHPIRVNVDRLVRLAPRFFRRTPAQLLVLFQPPTR